MAVWNYIRGGFASRVHGVVLISLLMAIVQQGQATRNAEKPSNDDPEETSQQQVTAADDSVNSTHGTVYSSSVYVSVRF